MNRRPVGVTLLTLALGWLSLGGFAIAAAAPLLDDRTAVRLAVIAVGLLYGAGALAAALGLWRMRAWAIHPLRLWGVAAVLSAGLPALLSLEPPSVGQILGGALVVGAAVGLTEMYVRRRLASTSDEGARVWT